MIEKLTKIINSSSSTPNNRPQGAGTGLNEGTRNLVMANLKGQKTGSNYLSPSSTPSNSIFNENRQSLSERVSNLRDKSKVLNDIRSGLAISDIDLLSTKAQVTMPREDNEDNIKSNVISKPFFFNKSILSNKSALIQSNNTPESQINNKKSRFLYKEVEGNGIISLGNGVSNKPLIGLMAEGNFNLGFIRKLINSTFKFNSEVANSQYVFFPFNKSNNISIVHQFNKAAKLLRIAFLAMGCLISRPVFKIVYTNNNLTQSNGYKDKAGKKIIIQLFYYIRSHLNTNPNAPLVQKTGTTVDSVNNLNTFPSDSDLKIKAYSPSTKLRFSKANNILPNPKVGGVTFSLDNPIVKDNRSTLEKYMDKFGFLADHLASIFGTEIELQLVRLYRPEYDSNILVQNLAIRSYRNQFGKLMYFLFSKLNISKGMKGAKLSLSNLSSEESSIPSELCGIKIRLGGRTFKQKIIPRRTVKRIQNGSLSRNRVKYVETSRFTGKTRRGSYTFTVTLGHVF